MSFQEEFFQKHSYHEIVIQLLKNGELAELPLTGHCMKPLLKENDLITVKPIPVHLLICGNIALYHINGRLKCHRFLKFKNIQGKPYLITKSDRRLGYDAPVPLESFLGIVIQIKKKNLIINYETKRWGRINYVLGKLSPFLSFAEYYLSIPIRLPRKCASRLFCLVMGINFRAWKEKHWKKQRRANILYK